MGKLLKWIPIFLIAIYLVSLASVIGMPILTATRGIDYLNENFIWPLWGAILMLAISAFYNDIYSYILIRTKSSVLFPGTIHKYVSIYSILIIMICSFITGAISGKSNIVSEDAQIKAYKEYYIAAETLLDSLGIYNDVPILDSDVGVDYLDKKMIVDQLPDNRQLWKK